MEEDPELAVTLPRSEIFNQSIEATRWLRRLELTVPGHRTNVKTLSCCFIVSSNAELGRTDIPASHKRYDQQETHTHKQGS